MLTIHKLAGAINAVVYYLCFYGAMFTIETDYKILLLGVGGFILVFIIAVNILIVKFGSRTFKIRD